MHACLSCNMLPCDIFQGHIVCRCGRVCLIKPVCRSRQSCPESYLADMLCQAEAGSTCLCRVWWRQGS